MILKTWLLGILTVSMALSVLRAMTPKGKFQTLLRFLGGISLMLVTVLPVIRADWSALGDSLTKWSDDIEVQAWGVETNREEELSTLIAEKTAAYIQEKAASLELTCLPVISCRVENGVPIPTEVKLDIPYQPVLSGIIRDELSIPAERQHWREE